MRSTLTNLILAWLVVAPSACQGEVANPAFPDDDDGRVLTQLIEAGSDLTKPHQPELFVYLPSEAAAKAAGSQLEEDGFVVEVRTSGSPVGHPWLCMATKEMLLTHEGMVDIRAKLEALARKHGGEYDGWGTPVVR